MRALIAYESLYGNTHIVANHIADGLRDGYEVTVLPVTEETIEMVNEADLLVVGGPTHIHGMSTNRSRQAAADAASKPGSGLTLEPDSVGPGLPRLAAGDQSRAWRSGGRVRYPARRPAVLHRPRESRDLTPPAAAWLPTWFLTRRASWSASRTR